MKTITETPLPYMAVGVLMLVRMAEPVQYTVVFPFINQMVQELHISSSSDDIGYYSGIVEGIFAVCQGCTVYHWARLSDRIGRKPVIMIGLAGTAISGSMFGFSQNFFAMLATRSLSGLMNGNVAVVRSAIGDITDSTNSTEAFALYGLVWTVGSILGNTLGGMASHPVERFPYIFAPGGLLEAYPFLLPCIVTTCITISGLLFTWVFLKESHQGVIWSRSRRSPGRPEAAAYQPVAGGEAESFAIGDEENEDDDGEADARTLVGDPDSPKFPQDRDGLTGSIKGDRNASVVQIPSNREGTTEDVGETLKTFTFMEIMSYPAIRRQLASMYLLSFAGSAWAALSLLVFYTPTEKGGLGMSTAEIGYAMAACGGMSIVSQLVLLTKFRRRYGIAGAYRLLNAGYVIVFATLPMLRLVVLASEGPHAGEDLTVGRGFFTWAAVLLWLGFSTVVGMANSFSMVIINIACPHPSCRGALNGLSTAVGCAARVFGPVVSSAAFAVSIGGEWNVLGGTNFWWILMVLICMLSAVVGLLVDDRPAEKPSIGHKDVEWMGMEEIETSAMDAEHDDSGLSCPGREPDRHS